MIKAALRNARMADFSFHSCMKFVLKCKNVLPKWFFFISEVFKGTFFCFCFLYSHFGGWVSSTSDQETDIITIKL